MKFANVVRMGEVVPNGLSFFANKSDVNPLKPADGVDLFFGFYFRVSERIELRVDFRIPWLKRSIKLLGFLGILSLVSCGGKGYAVHPEVYGPTTYDAGNS